ADRPRHRRGDAAGDRARDRRRGRVRPEGRHRSAAAVRASPRRQSIRAGARGVIEWLEVDGVEDWLDEVLTPAGVPRALATIVHTSGSTPREPGARMVIYRDGRTRGTIGGGCGEAQVRNAA